SHRWSAWLSVSQQGFESLATALDVGADTDFMWLGVGERLIRLSEEVATGSNGISSTRVLEQVGRELRASEDGSPEWAFELASEDGRVFLGAVQQLEIEQDRVRYCVVSDRAVLLQDMQGPASTKIYVLLVLSGLGLVGLLVTGGRALRQRRAAGQGQGYRHAEEEALLDLIQSGESERLEFKSTMRWNVRADRPGKEVELSWLTAVAAFLNSSGGTLLIGVDDDGNTTGIEADKFPNEDRFLLHFNNLVKEHIGLEFAGLIDFEIRTVTGSRIMVLDCRPSDQPVFLKKGNQEDFFIRVGPGSRKLSASEMLEFLKTR
ncbi:MAG: ATP-binding protein, partial [Acidobacteriota bacterium]